MIGLSINAGRLRIHEVPCAANVDTMEGGNGVHVLETTVDDGNHHALTTHTDVVEALTLYGFDLCRCSAITLTGNAVALFEMFVVFCFQCRW